MQSPTCIRSSTTYNHITRHQWTRGMPPLFISRVWSHLACRAVVDECETCLTLGATRSACLRGVHRPVRPTWQLFFLRATAPRHYEGEARGGAVLYSLMPEQ